MDTSGNPTAPGGELGSRARWGRVGYSGEAFAPARGTYQGTGSEAGKYTTLQDSGLAPFDRAGLANLIPIVGAALYEAGFAMEFGALSTWRN